jgi:hypothetical protein
VIGSSPPKTIPPSSIGINEMIKCMREKKVEEFIIKNIDPRELY